ncbi:MAG: hypothetical protein JXA14_25375 [Anaerolineae bacterium]|nr:hypothetical protein [Anaerolineae bacterium]
MTILLRWLVNYAWVFYFGCAIGAIIYTVRALAAHRQRGLALFTLERETATSRVVRAWAMVLVFVFIGAAILVSANFILPDLLKDMPLESPTPQVSSPSPTPTVNLTPSPTPEFAVPTVASTLAVVVPTPPSPTAAPATSVPVGAAAGDVRVRFGNPAFAELVSYSLSAVEVTTAQPLQLTLNWRALEEHSPINYVVFTHLRSGDGNIIAQHDGPPAGGARSLVEWSPGETIVDVHQMAFVDGARDYTGAATLIVGLYNPEAAHERVVTDTGADYVTLVTVNVVPQ